MTTEQKTLDAALRAWRATEAKSLGKPAFVVFGDRTLRQIVLDAPSTIEDLQNVSGIGPVKAERWGRSILSVLNGSSSSDVGSAVPPLSSPVPKVAAGSKQGRLPRSMPTVQTAISYLQQRSDSGTAAAPLPSLEQALKVWRMHEARRLNRAPFDLLRDPAIQEIASLKPRTVEALRTLTCVERGFADQFGEAVCSVIASNDRQQA